MQTGREGISEIFGRIRKWRVRPTWMAIAVGSPWLFYILAGIILAATGQPWPDLSIFGNVQYLPYLTFVGTWLLWILSYGLGEETGWRGFLLPRLQTKYSALTSSLILSLIWASWHAPMFLYHENFIELGLIGTIFWAIGLMFGSVLLTWIYNNNEGSILLTAIWHGTFNLFTGASGQAAAMTSAIITMFVMVLVVLIIIAYKPENLSRIERQTQV